MKTGAGAKPNSFGSGTLETAFNNFFRLRQEVSIVFPFWFTE
jgi:hypothetical protein